VPEEQHHSNVSAINRRLEKRKPVHVPVEITGINASGLQFAERGRLENVSELGCSFSLQSVVYPGEVVGVKPLGPDDGTLQGEHPRLFVVVWVHRKWNSSKVGARSLQEGELSNSSDNSNKSTSKVPAK